MRSNVYDFTTDETFAFRRIDKYETTQSYKINSSPYSVQKKNNKRPTIIM